MAEWLKSRLGWRTNTDDLSRAYKRVLRTPEGLRLVVPDLIEYSGLLAPSPAHGDVFMQGRFAGRRDVGLRVSNMINLSEEDLALILTGRDVLRPEDFR